MTSVPVEYRYTNLLNPSPRLRFLLQSLAKAGASLDIISSAFTEDIRDWTQPDQLAAHRARPVHLIDTRQDWVLERMIAVLELVANG